MENTSIRLKEYMKKTGYRQVDLINKIQPVAKSFGLTVQKSHVSQWVNGKHELDQTWLTIISKALGITEPWVMGYDVPMYDTSANIRHLSNYEKEILEPFNKLNIDGKEKVIDYTYDLLESEKYIEEETVEYIGKAAAGNGYNYLDNITIEKTIEKKSRPKYDFIIQVVGDSMEPKISDGALAFVKLNTDYDNGKIYVVDDDGSVYIKKVYFENEKIILRSINKNYKDIEITFSQGFRILGEVVDWE